MATASEFLTAEQAAAYLGVSRATLYAYVSRGRIVSEAGHGSSRSRRYPRASLDELKDARERRRDPARSASLFLGPPVLDSALTLIADGRLWYRGRDACELSRTATLEEVASLLWTGTTENARDLFPRSPSPRRRSLALSDRLVATLMEARAEPAVSLSQPGPSTLRAAARMIRQLFDAVGSTGSGTLAERLARGWRAPSADALRAALILCADHELNPSSFTARCVASTDAPIPNVLLAALCALEGRRHGGVSDRVEELLHDAERDGVPSACRRAVSAGGGLPGSGHPVYPDGDPRAKEILAHLDLPEGDPVREIIRFARHDLGVQPSLELALAALARSARLPRGAAFTIFALGRSVGWIAHALEAAAEGRVIRPRARYIGPPVRA